MTAWTTRDRWIIALAAGTGALVLFVTGRLGGTESAIALYGRPVAALLLGALAHGGRRGPLRLLAAWFALLAVGIVWGVFASATGSSVRATATAGAVVLTGWAIVLWRLRPDVRDSATPRI